VALAGIGDQKVAEHSRCNALRQPMANPWGQSPPPRTPQCRARRSPNPAPPGGCSAGCCPNTPTTPA
jgi:hypothetical protein